MGTRKYPTAASTTTAKALEAVAMGFPEPPVKLRARELPFWKAIMHARMPQQWCEFDLHPAATLARTWFDLEMHRELLLDEGEIDLDGKPNPRCALIDRLVARSLTLTRSLQLNAIAKDGQSASKGTSKGEAAQIAEIGAVLDDDPDELFARPVRH